MAITEQIQRKFSDTLSEDLRKDSSLEAQIEYQQRIAHSCEKQQLWPYYHAAMRRICELNAQLATKTKALILADAIEQCGYQTSQIEVTDETFTLEDGNIARFVKIYVEGEDDYGYPDRTLDMNDSYFATVIDGQVYGNVELDALIWEYTRIVRKFAKTV